MLMAQSLESRPTVVDFREDNPWVKLAQAHWADAKKVRKVKPEVIKRQLWDPLEAEGFTNRSLLILENLNILEKCISRRVTMPRAFRRANKLCLQVPLADVHRGCLESSRSSDRPSRQRQVSRASSDMGWVNATSIPVSCIGPC